MRSPREGTGLVKSLGLANREPVRRPSSPEAFEGWLLLLALAVLWGTSFFFTRVAVEQLRPELVATVRIAVAAAALNAVRARLGLSLPRDVRAWVSWLPLALSGSVLPFALIGWGQQGIPSGLAGVLMAVSPLVTVALAHFAVAGERLHERKLFGVALGLGGVVILLGPESLLGLGSADTLPRQLAVLGGAALYSLNTVLTRRAPAVHPLVFASGVLGVASLIALPAGLAAAFRSGIHADAGAWLSVVWLGLVPTGLATLLHYRLVSLEGAGFTSLVSYAIPVIALLAGAVALGERVETSALAALGLILLGVAAARTKAPGSRREGSVPPTRASRAPGWLPRTQRGDVRA